LHIMPDIGEGGGGGNVKTAGLLSAWQRTARGH
jgi:hypothetical protein